MRPGEDPLRITPERHRPRLPAPDLPLERLVLPVRAAAEFLRNRAARRLEPTGLDQPATPAHARPAAGPSAPTEQLESPAQQTSRQSMARFTGALPSSTGVPRTCIAGGRAHSECKGSDAVASWQDGVMGHRRKMKRRCQHVGPPACSDVPNKLKPPLCRDARPLVRPLLPEPPKRATHLPVAQTLADAPRVAPRLAPAKHR